MQQNVQVAVDNVVKVIIDYDDHSIIRRMHMLARILTRYSMCHDYLIAALISSLCSAFVFVSLLCQYDPRVPHLKPHAFHFCLHVISQGNSELDGAVEHQKTARKKVITGTFRDALPCNKQQAAAHSVLHSNQLPIFVPLLTNL